MPKCLGEKFGKLKVIFKKYTLSICFGFFFHFRACFCLFIFHDIGAGQNKETTNLREFGFNSIPEHTHKGCPVCNKFP